MTKSTRVGTYDREFVWSRYADITVLLRNARNMQGWPQQKLGDKIGVNRTVISMYENRHLKPSLENFFAWIDSLGYEITIHSKR